MFEGFRGRLRNTYVSKEGSEYVCTVLSGMFEYIYIYIYIFFFSFFWWQSLYIWMKDTLESYNPILIV